MSDIMRIEDQERILESLNDYNLPFDGYQFTRGSNGRMERLGGGGFGSVYASKGRVEDRAIKVIGFQEPPITDPDEINKCADEVWIQAAVSAKCREIVQIRDVRTLCIKFDDDYNILSVEPVKNSAPVDEDCGLFLFISMERLQGVVTPLKRGRKQLCQRLNPPEEAEILKLAIDIGRALHAAHTHSKKIIHRDVKLENIFWDERTRVYKLGDFGIARTTLSGGTMTRGPGTEGYVAPEVLKGSKYDVKADMYSYGITLYSLLNELRLPSIGVQYSGETLPPPKNGSPALQQIVLKACSYNASDRYESMEELLHALENISAPVSTVSIPLPQPEKEEEFIPLLSVTEKGTKTSAQEELPMPEVTRRDAVGEDFGQLLNVSPDEEDEEDDYFDDYEPDEEEDVPDFDTLFREQLDKHVKEQLPPPAPGPKGPFISVESPDLAAPAKKPEPVKAKAPVQEKTEASEQSGLSRYYRAVCEAHWGIYVGIGLLMCAVSVFLNKWFEPKLGAWQLYAALVLHGLAGWFFCYCLPNEHCDYADLFRGTRALQNRPLYPLCYLRDDLYGFFKVRYSFLIISLAVIVLLAFFGFTVYCIIALGWNVLLLLMALFLIVGFWELHLCALAAMTLSMIAAVIDNRAAVIAALMQMLEIGFSTPWIIMLLILVGIFLLLSKRTLSGVVYMAAVALRLLTPYTDIAPLLFLAAIVLLLAGRYRSWRKTRLMDNICRIICFAVILAGIAVWALTTYTSVAVPELLLQLHLLRVGLIALGIHSVIFGGISSVI